MEPKVFWFLKITETLKFDRFVLNLQDTGQNTIGGLDSGGTMTGSIAWGDVNNGDGLLDLAVTGTDKNGTPRTVIFINQQGVAPNNWTYVEPLGTGQGLTQGSLNFGHLNGNASKVDADLYVAGIDAAKQPHFLCASKS